MQKMIKKMLPFLMLLLPVLLPAYEKIYSGLDIYIDYNSCLISGENGYLIGGHDQYGSGMIMQVDASGDCVWTKTYPEYSIRGAVKNAGGYMLAAEFYDNGSPAFMQVDAAGNCVWTRTTASSGTRPNSIIMTPDNGYIMAASFYDVTTSQTMYLEKTDASGNCVWARSYSDYLGADKIINDGNGNYVVAGWDHEYGLLMKVDSNGDCVWASSDNYPNMEIYDVTAASGGYLFTGYSYPDPLNTELERILVGKIDTGGNSSFMKFYDWGMFHEGNSICSSPQADYGFYIAGRAAPNYTNESQADILVMQVDALGNCINVVSKHTPTGFWWPKIMYRSAGDYILSSSTYTDRNLYVADGHFNPLSGLPPGGGGNNPSGTYACPQPAADTIKFVYALDKPAEVTVSIYNFMNKPVGKNVSGEIADDNVNTTVDISKLPAGIYYYKIIAKFTDGTSKKFAPAKFMVKK